MIFHQQYVLLCVYLWELVKLIKIYMLWLFAADSKSGKLILDEAVFLSD